MKHKTAELEGALLDAAVAMACELEGELLQAPDGFSGFFLSSYHAFQPSRRWEDAGPIIERERIMLWPYPEGADDDHWEPHWVSQCWGSDPDAERDEDEDGTPTEWRGETALLAAMRAFVAAKLGEEVELP